MIMIITYNKYIPTPQSKSDVKSQMMLLQCTPHEYLKSLLSSPISNPEESMEIYISRIQILAHTNMVRELWNTCTIVGYIVCTYVVFISISKVSINFIFCLWTPCCCWLHYILPLHILSLHQHISLFCWLGSRSPSCIHWIHTCATYPEH